MPSGRMQNPADLVKYYTDLISEERRKLEECLANISDYANRLRAVADDTGRRLITKE